MVPKPVDFIVFSLFRHDEKISSTALEMALELSEKHRVFYIEHPVTYKDFYSHNSTVNLRAGDDNTGNGFHLKKLNDNFFVITPPPVFPVNFLPEGKFYEWLRKKNENRLFNILKALINKFNISNYVFINFYAPVYFKEITEVLKPFRKIYYVLDEIEEVKYTARHGTKAEHEQVVNADIVLCSSKKLYNKYKDINTAAFYLPNGVNINLFKISGNINFPVPEELKNIKGKIIGYVGSIDYRIDIDLINAIAKFHFDKTICLVGPSGINNTIMQNNILFTGSKLPAQLPAYLNHFDCLIIPFKKNRLTAAIYPLKLNEYLASGKPVITTDFSEDLEEFNDLIIIAKNENEFIEGVESALNEGENKKQERIEKAIENSWTNRVARLLEIISV